MKEIILATSNKGKIAELRAILSGFHCIPQEDLGISSLDEIGFTFVENAISKARFACQESGKPALADDSGLVVAALQGEPGIRSARFAGNEASSLENNNLLLKKLEGVPYARREAYFFCAIAIVKHPSDPTPLISTGRCNGRITTGAIGNQGFGYDPIFYIESEQHTMAELSNYRKNELSHRAKALSALKQHLTSYFAE